MIQIVLSKTTKNKALSLIIGEIGNDAVISNNLGLVTDKVTDTLNILVENKIQFSISYI